MAIQLYKDGDFSAEKIKDLKVTHDSLFTEVPIIVKNSHLVNELLLELSEQVQSKVSDPKVVFTQTAWTEMCSQATLHQKSNAIKHDLTKIFIYSQRPKSKQKVVLFPDIQISDIRAVQF